MKTNKRIACITGATGLVGGHLLDMLIEDDSFEQVIVVNRRSQELQDESKVKEVIMDDFSNMNNHQTELKATDYFCCLGTTINKAGSKENFKKVDYQYVVDFAAVAKEHDGDSFSLISAMGAKSSSMIFYNKVKGETEDAVKSLKINRTYIHRPSLITGERNEKRSGEATAKWLMTKLDFIFKGPLKKYGPVSAKQIAHAMKHFALNSSENFKVIESDKIQEVK
ncbi:oxidoreductase [Marivirga atlantica]|uniref:NAD(P)H-binding protein n=1 Tax=Marivirga atlantica TaxID=1548457 RepID=A0A937DE11_9BACT|nr:NAD(P)H-binding protein [Marivirga atlantica]MBL0764777.1 NAD(P)H-binding protein [Marivirga atlantica]